jgi:hypothetical protein
VARRDVADGEQAAAPIVDAGGFLDCGCHGTMREHVCSPESEGVSNDD